MALRDSAILCSAAANLMRRAPTCSWCFLSRSAVARHVRKARCSGGVGLSSHLFLACRSTRFFRKLRA